MALNETLTDKVRIALSHEPNVVEKKMFRGITFMVNGKMCISVGNDEIMCRIDPALHCEVIQKQGVRSVIMRGREYKGYINVHENNIRTEQELQYWIDLALAFNPIAKASVKKK